MSEGNMSISTDPMPTAYRPRRESKYRELYEYINKHWKSLQEGQHIKYREPGVAPRVLNNRLNDYFRRNPPNIPVQYRLIKICSRDYIHISIVEDE